MVMVAMGDGGGGGDGSDGGGSGEGGAESAMLMPFVNWKLPLGIAGTTIRVTRRRNKEQP